MLQGVGKNTSQNSQSTRQASSKRPPTIPAQRIPKLHGSNQKLVEGVINGDGSNGYHCSYCPLVLAKAVAFRDHIALPTTPQQERRSRQVHCGQERHCSDPVRLCPSVSPTARQSHQLSLVFSRPLPTDYSRDSSLPPVSLPLSVSSIVPLSLPTSGGYKRPGHSSGPLQAQQWRATPSKTTSMLSRNEALHSSKTYSCPVAGCLKIFKQNSDLRRHHVTVHEGRKDFKVGLNLG